MTVHSLIVPDPDLLLLTGLVAGTALMTLRGEVAVERLRPGERVITRDRGAVALRGVDTRLARVAPVRIVAGLLAALRPARDLLVGPGTRLLVRGAPLWHGAGLMTAADLVDGDFVSVERPREITLHRLHFDAPQVVYAEGLEVQA